MFKYVSFTPLCEVSNMKKYKKVVDAVAREINAVSQKLELDVQPNLTYWVYNIGNDPSRCNRNCRFPSKYA